MIVACCQLSFVLERQSRRTGPSTAPTVEVIDKERTS